MKNILKLFLLITAFASPCALNATALSDKDRDFLWDNKAKIEKEYNEFAELFKNHEAPFEKIEEKLQAFSPPLKKAILAFKNYCSKTLLHLLIDSDLNDNTKVKAIKLFIDNGADINAEGDSFQTPLQTAIKKKSSIEVIKALIKNGADVNVGSLEDTPLYLAIKYKHSIDVFEALIESGAQVNEKKNYNSNFFNGQAIDVTMRNIRPLYAALDANADPEIIKFLLQNGAEVNAVVKIEVVSNPSQSRSETPLFIATRTKEDTTTDGEKIIKDGKIIELLLQYGADPSIKCLYEGQEMTAQEYASSKLEMDESEIKALFATQPNTEKIKLIKKQVAPGNSSWSTSSKVGTAALILASTAGAYYLYKQYQDKKKRDQENQKRKADQEKLEKLEKLEKEMIKQAKAKEVAIPTAV